MSSEVETSLVALFRRYREIPRLRSEWQSLLQFSQLSFDLLEIWQLPRVVIALGVLDHPVLIDDERRTFRHAAHPEIDLRQEGVVNDAVILCDLVFVIAQQGDADLFLLRKRLLR